MISNPHPLTPIWDAYNIAVDGFEVATKALMHLDSQNLLDNTCFARQSSKEAKDSLKDTLHQQINDLFVMSFWAAFERFLRDYLQEKGTTLQKTQPAVLGQTMYAYFEEEVEFWKMEEVLEDILKEFLGPRKVLASQARHILHYRNWIAHGKNPKVKNRPSRIHPDFAYKILGEIIDLLILNQ
jgi:hypothetical protein